MKKKLPDHLAISGKQRTTESLLAIEELKETLIKELHSGTLLKALKEDKSYLNLSRFCVRAGLGENFLNGILHKNSLKPTIKEFLQALKRDALASGNHPTANEGDSSDAKHLSKILKRTADLLHAETLRANEAEKQLREILASTQPKIVDFLR